MDFEEARQRREAAAALASAWQHSLDEQRTADERLRAGIRQAFADRRAGRLDSCPTPLHAVARREERP